MQGQVAFSRLDILIAQEIPLNIQHIPNRLVRAVAIHVEDMTQRGRRARVTVGTRGLPGIQKQEPPISKHDLQCPGTVLGPGNMKLN
jgi:hypothetical protein